MRWVILLPAVILGACGTRGQGLNSEEAGNAPAVVEQNHAAPAPAPPPHSIAAPKRQLEEPHGAIDPKSLEAAGQVVQHYWALIEQRRLAEAESLWGDPQAAKAFSASLQAGTHLQIGDLTPAEGAAGSIYTTMPVVFYGERFRRAATVSLRRVNDVPGSTEAQRRWQIERIAWDGEA